MHFGPRNKLAQALNFPRPVCIAFIPDSSRLLCLICYFIDLLCQQARSPRVQVFIPTVCIIRKTLAISVPSKKTYRRILTICQALNQQFQDVFFFFFGCTNSMQKFPSQGSDLSHSSDDVGSLTHQATRGLLC